MRICFFQKILWRINSFSKDYCLKVQNYKKKRGPYFNRWWNLISGSGQSFQKWHGDKKSTLWAKSWFLGAKLTQVLKQCIFQITSCISYLAIIQKYNRNEFCPQRHNSGWKIKHFWKFQKILWAFLYSLYLLLLL